MDLRHPTRQSLESEATAFAGNDVYACRTLAVGLDGITMLAPHPRKGGEFVRLQCCFEAGHWLDADGVIEECYIRDGEWTWSVAFVGLDEHQKAELRAILRTRTVPPRRAAPSKPAHAAPTQPPSSPFTAPTLPPSSPFHSSPSAAPSSPFNARPPSSAFHEVPARPPSSPARPPSSPARPPSSPARPPSSPAAAPTRPPASPANELPTHPSSAPFQPVPPRSPRDPVAPPSGIRPRPRTSSPPPISLAELYRDALAEVKEAEKTHRNMVGADDAVWQARNWSRKSG